MPEAGEFSLKQVGGTAFTTNDRDEVTAASDWEGTATGYGTVFGTFSVTFPLAEAGGASGSCTWVSAAVLDDGVTLAGIGAGTWVQVAGQHTWTVKLELRVSNGDRLRSEGTIDLATRTFAGKFSAA
jgi:hypothetical protein